MWLVWIAGAGCLGLLAQCGRDAPGVGTQPDAAAARNATVSEGDSGQSRVRVDSGGPAEGTQDPESDGDSGVPAEEPQGSDGGARRVLESPAYERLRRATTSADRLSALRAISREADAETMYAVVRAWASQLLQNGGGESTRGVLAGVAVSAHAAGNHEAAIAAVRRLVSGILPPGDGFDSVGERWRWVSGGARVFPFGDSEPKPVAGERQDDHWFHWVIDSEVVSVDDGARYADWLSSLPADSATSSERDAALIWAHVVGFDCLLFFRSGLPPAAWSVIEEGGLYADADLSTAKAADAAFERSLRESHLVDEAWKKRWVRVRGQADGDRMNTGQALVVWSLARLWEQRLRDTEYPPDAALNRLALWLTEE